MKKKLLSITSFLAVALLCACQTTQSATTEGETVSPKSEEVITEESGIDESSLEEGTQMSENASTLTYIGHAAVKLQTSAGTVIYIDPAYEGGDYSTPADIILITHEHSDHNKTSDCTLKDDCRIIKYNEALTDGEYKTFTVGDVTIQAVPAGGNANHNVKKCVGYLVTFDGITVYHAGDTSTLDTMTELSDLGIDYAMYPIDGVYNMDATEATDVANMVKARVNIPIHEFDEGDVKKSDNFLPEGKLVIPYGDSIELTAE